MRTLLLVTVLALAAGPPGCGPATPPKATPESKESATSFRLTSPAFGQSGEIPKRHACDGEDVSPPLAWTGAPAGTKSFALIVDDPDAPLTIWVHWVLYNLPATTTSLPADLTEKNLPPGVGEGLNDWKQAGWRGPCPLYGRHRYFHKLYALDIVLPDLRRPTKPALEKAFEGHVLAQAELVGTYQRPR